MEPKDRLRKARRVLAVQTSLERLAAWRVGALEYRLSIMRDQQSDLVRFLEGEVLGDVFAAAMLRRLGRLAESQAVLKEEKVSCEAARWEERLRLRCAELAVDDLGKAVRRSDEMAELESVIDLAQQRVRSEQG
jgi:hypothetical protein